MANRHFNTSKKKKKEELKRKYLFTEILFE